MLLGHVIENTALRHPERDAIVFGDSRTTFGELADRVGRVSAGGQVRVCLLYTSDAADE